MLRYYRRGEEYVRRGPPHVAAARADRAGAHPHDAARVRDGVALLALDERHGTLGRPAQGELPGLARRLGLHVLAHLLRLPRLWRLRAPGLTLRVALVGASLVAGAALATATLPGADRLQDRASAHVGFDKH